MSRVTEVLSATRQPFFSQHKEKTLKGEFERVALPHLNQLYRAAYYLTKSEADADDLVQGAFLKAYRCFYQFESGTNCRAWLLTILRNLFLNDYARKKRQPEMVDWEKIDQAYDLLLERAHSPEKNSPESFLFSRLIGHEVQQALKKLPEEFRLAIALVDIEDLTYDEAGKVMGCPTGTVRSRVSRGRRILQVALMNYALESGVVRKRS